MITPFSGFRAEAAQSSPRLRIYVRRGLAVATILAYCLLFRVSPSGLPTQIEDKPEPKYNDFRKR